MSVCDEDELNFIQNQQNVVFLQCVPFLRAPYLPDPKDGSLYWVNPVDGIVKQPYTIPELVSASPCKSSEGILYTGQILLLLFHLRP